MIKKQKSSISLNFILQFIYQTIMLVIPLIVSPYLTRRIGSNALGTYTYISTTAYYFIIFANLGILKHGQRAISGCINDEERLRRTFWSLYVLHLIIGLVAVLSYCCFFMIWGMDSKDIYVIEIIYVSSALFDVTWLFYGLENFKSVVIKNAIIKIVETFLIFIFVQNANDIWKYALIVSSGIFLGQFVLVPQAISLIPPIRFNWIDVKNHFKPLLVFSITIIASTIYMFFDKTLLGLMTNKENVAFYEYGEKIVAIPKNFILIIGTVLFPRACKIANDESKAEEKKILFDISFIVTYFIGFAAFFGLMSIGTEFALIYYGDEFYESGKVMQFMSILPLLIGMGDIVRSQILIPNNEDRKYVFAVVLNAVLNLIISSIMISIVGLYGAVIGTIVSEFVSGVYLFIVVRNKINIGHVLFKSVPFIVSGVLMFVSIYICSQFFERTVLFLILKIIIGGLVYLSCIASYMLIFDKKYINYIKKFRKDKD